MICHYPWGQRTNHRLLATAHKGLKRARSRLGALRQALGRHNGRKKHRYDVGALAHHNCCTHLDSPPPVRRGPGDCCAVILILYFVGQPCLNLNLSGHLPLVPSVYPWRIHLIAAQIQANFARRSENTVICPFDKSPR